MDDDLRDRVQRLERRLDSLESDRRRADRTWLDLGPFTLTVIGAAGLLFLLMFVFLAIRER